MMQTTRITADKLEKCNINNYVSKKRVVRVLSTKCFT